MDLLEDLGGVVFGLDFLGGDDALDAAVGRDDEGGAECAHVFAAGKFLLAPHAEFLDETVVGVAYQGEWQGIFGGELAVRLGRIDAHADYLIARGFEPGQVVAQVAGLGRASRGGIFRIEIEGYFFARKLAETHLAAVHVAAKEVVDLVVYIHHNAKKVLSIRNISLRLVT